MNRFSVFTFLTNSMYSMPNHVTFYNTLPLYHSNGGMVVFGQTITSGHTAVLRKKFSASNFWDDIVKYQVTSFNYIGEICRFLLAKPVQPSENNHKIQFIVGNGLKP